MKMFLTPETTFALRLRFSAKRNTFVPCSHTESEVVFDVATPTRAQLHEHFGALQGYPGRGAALDYSEIDHLIWGDEKTPGLVRKVIPDIKTLGTPHPSLTLAIARVIREKLGQSVPVTDEPDAPATPAPIPGIDSEGNSDSP